MDDNLFGCTRLLEASLGEEASHALGRQLGQDKLLFPCRPPVLTLLERTGVCQAIGGPSLPSRQ